MKLLDLSDNTVSDLQVNLSGLLVALGKFIEDSECLFEINLSGMQIGPSITYLVPFIAQHKLLSRIDLSNNLLD